MTVTHNTYMDNNNGTPEMKKMTVWTVTGSYLNNSYRNMQSREAEFMFDLTDFANLDAPDSIAAGSTSKVRSYNGQEYMTIATNIRRFYE